MLSTPAHAGKDLDSIVVDPAHHEILFENDQVRVVRWVVRGRDKTLEHTHPDNLNICLTDYNGKVAVPDAKPFELHAKAGEVSWRKAGAHMVENLTDQTMIGILVEPKHPASQRPAGSPDPVTADPKHHKIEFENDQIRVLREHRTPGSIPLHGHPDAVQVLLTDFNATLTTGDGHTEPFRAKAGDVRWRPATQHQGKVVGDKPVEQILVEMKGTLASRL